MNVWIFNNIEYMCSRESRDINMKHIDLFVPEEMLHHTVILIVERNTKGICISYDL